jgi:hypothetical protein
MIRVMIRWHEFKRSLGRELGSCPSSHSDAGCLSRWKLGDGFSGLLDFTDRHDRKSRA